MSNKSYIKFSVEHFSSLVLYIYNLKIKTIEEIINNKIKQFPKFFKNIPCIIDISNLTEHDYLYWQEAYHRILNTGLYIIGVSGYINKKWKLALIKSNIPILNKKISIDKNFSSKSAKYKKNYSDLVVDKPVRSGQIIYAKNKNLIIINTVSSGAEVIADGNIHIYGTLRGKAFAGVGKADNQKCQIFCTQLLAECISIAGNFWINEDIPKSHLGKSARFFLKKNILTIQKFSL